MTKYQYRALKSNKDIINGEIEADTPRVARDLIRDLGFTPLEITEENLEIKDISENSANTGGIEFLSLSDKILFISELQVMLGSGISILDALQTICKKSHKAKLKKIAYTLQGEIMNGKTFAQAINYLYHDLFGETFIDLCITGENTGEMARTLGRILTMLRKQEDIKHQIIQALIYPSMLILMIIGILIFFAKLVFPAFMGFINANGGDIPPFAQAVADFMTFIGANWLLCIIGILAVCGAIFFLANNQYTRKFFDKLLVRIPLVNDFVNYINLTNYMCIMTISYECGVPFTKTILLAEKTIQNCEIRKKAEQTTKLIEKGKQFSEALEISGLLPPALVTMIGAGEKAGNLGKMLQDCLDIIDKKVELVLQALTKAFEPAMIVIIGGIVLALVIAFFQMYTGLITTF